MIKTSLTCLASIELYSQSDVTIPFFRDDSDVSSPNWRLKIMSDNRESVTIGDEGLKK